MNAVEKIIIRESKKAKRQGGGRSYLSLDYLIDSCLIDEEDFKMTVRDTKYFVLYGKKKIKLTIAGQIERDKTWYEKIWLSVQKLIPLIGTTSGFSFGLYRMLPELNNLIDMYISNLF